MKQYIQLMRIDKPIGTLLLLWPTVWAIFIAANGRPSLFILLVFCVEIFLARSLGCIINDVCDVDFDRCVARTKNRPLASGGIPKKNALILFGIIGSITFLIAFICLKVQSVLLSIPALLILMSYPLMKRCFALPQLYLGVAFSFGILMAYIEILGYLPWSCWLIFSANLFWVLGYDTIYAMVDKEDDLKIKIKTSAITFGNYVVLIIAACYILMLGTLFYLGIKLDFNYPYWILLLSALAILMYQIKVLSIDKTHYFAMFLLNNQVGMVITLGIVLNYWWC